MAEELNRLKRIKSLLQDTKLIDSHTISAVVAECDAVIFAQRSAVQQDLAVHVCQIKDAVCGDRSDLWCDKCPKTIAALQRALTQRPAAQTERDDDDGDVTGQPGPLPETGWDEVPAGAFRKPSPTAGMNLGERIKHVGGRENAAGYIEFGSVAAVRALVRQYLRDLPAPQQATPEPVGEPYGWAVTGCHSLYRGEWAEATARGEAKRCGGTARAVALYARPAPGVPMAWPKARDVGRFGDMHPIDHLRVGLDSDNDVYVSVWGEDGGASVEFCNPGGGGGGSSRRTREALIALMVAMEADNAERPDKDWWARRNGTAQAKGGE